MGSNIDLRKYQDESVTDAFSKLVSNKEGYKAILDKKEEKFCLNPDCKRQLEPHEKFCPSCGKKVEEKAKNVICFKCYNVVKEGDKFCGSCGEKVEE